jgi:hypothetical protein
VVEHHLRAGLHHLIGKLVKRLDGEPDSAIRLNGLVRRENRFHLNPTGRWLVHPRDGTAEEPSMSPALEGARTAAPICRSAPVSSSWKDVGL